MSWIDDNYEALIEEDDYLPIIPAYMVEEKEEEEEEDEYVF